MRHLKHGVFLFCLAFPLLGLAKTLSVLGPVYPIAEMEFVQWAKAQMQEKEKAGEVALWQTEQAKNMKAYADRPTPVEDLMPAQTSKSWLYDPTLTLQHDLRDHEGTIRLPAGSRINPLDHVTWTHTLLFYDGDNADQVAWVKDQDVKLKGQGMLILIRGSISQQMKEMKKPIYFDQGCVLVKKFGIQHSPASVYQEGKKLKITEVKP